MTDLGRADAQMAPSRSYGLDLLPLLQEACPDTLADVPEDRLKGGRPTFRYRLPETRLDEASWSLAYEWNRWCVVEKVAADADLLATLAQEWQAYRDKLTTTRGNWLALVTERLNAARLISS